MALTPPSTPATGDPGTSTWADQVAAGISDYESACLAYTPTLTSNGTAPTLGTGGSAVGVYKVFGGRWCYFTATLIWGTAPTVGSGIYLVSLPVPWVNDGVTPVFTASYGTSSAFYGFTTQIFDQTHVYLPRHDGTSNDLGPAYPVAPASGNILRLNGSYRVG